MTERENEMSRNAFMSYLLVEEDEFEVEAGAEHEDVVKHLDLGDRARRQRVRHRHQADVLHGGSMELEQFCIISQCSYEKLGGI